jgi:hypothetical protein
MNARNSEKQWNVISLGGGVQSSAMALMASCGELGPMPDFAIFADTHWLEPKLAFPLYRVTKGKLSDEMLRMRTTKDGRVYARTAIPLYTINERGDYGMASMRTCTSDFKIKPILTCLREKCGIKRGQKTPTVTSWIGISLDEQQRMKDSRDKWVVNRWPLIEKRMDRGMCIRWMLDRGYPKPQKSACRFCPFHDNDEWRRQKNEEPDEFVLSVQFEKDIQAVKAKSDNFNSTPFLHNSRKPLDTIDFRNDIDHGQQLLSFMDECEGMCGV